MKTQKKRKSLVKLTGLHAISKEHHSPKNITKDTNETEYQRVRYYTTPVNEQNNNNFTDLYSQLQKIFRKYNTYQPFSNLSSILSQSGSNKVKKNLVILPGKGSENYVQQITKSKDQNTNVVLVGQAEPKDLYLNKNVVLVTNSAQKIYDFLDAKRLIQYPVRLELQSLISYMQTIINNAQLEKRSNQLIGIKSNQPVSEQPAVVNVNQNEYQLQRRQLPTSPQNKHKIKKIKSPTKIRPNTQSSQQPIIMNNHTITVLPPIPGQINQTADFRTNKQGEIIPKKQVEVSQPYSAPIIQKPLQPKSISSIREINQHQTDSYLLKKGMSSHNYNQINNKYRSSFVIPQTSDEYRGSNKDSLLNQQVDKSRQEPYQVSNFIESKHYTQVQVPGPLEERAERKIVQSMMNNYSDRQVFSGNQINRDFMKQTGVKMNNVGPQTIEKQVQIDEVQRPKILKKTQNIDPLQVHVQTQTNIKEQQKAPQIPRNETKTSYNQISYYNSSNYPANYLNNVQKSTHPNYHITSPANQTKQTGSYQGGTNVRVIQGNTSPIVKRQIIKSPQVRVFGGTSPSTTIKTDKTNYATKSFNLEGYERVQVNGIAMYRKKVQTKPATTQSHQIDGSPKVIRYQVSPRQNIMASPPEGAKIQSNQVKGSRYTPYATYNTLNTKSNEIPSQNNQQVLYNRSSTYMPNYTNYTISANNNEPPRTIQNKSNTVTSYKPTEYQTNKVLYNRQVVIPAVPKQNVTLKLHSNQDEFIDRVGVQRELKQKAEVQRREYKELKVQSPNLRLLNDSNWLSKPSDLHSDGSILRRNNIRFGIKLKQKQQRLNQSCVNETKIQNGIFNINDLNKQMALHRKIVGQQEILLQETKYVHINTQLSAIHYLFQEELRYYEKKLNLLFGTNDKVDFFSCIEELSQKAYSLMDCGFVIMIKEEGQKINPTMLPQDYYVIFIEKSEDYLLQIDGDHKKIRVDSLERLTLAQKIILDSKLYQYVIYRGGDALVQGLGDKFANTQFIAEKLEIELSNQILDCYYEDQPRLTRLYTLCLQQELKNTLKVLESYEKMNPFFNKASCKVICPLKNSTNIQRLNKDFPSVLFLTSLSVSYKEIITQAHRNDKKLQLNIKPDRLYLHQKQSSIATDIQKQFPGRFQIIVFQSLLSISKKTSKYQLQKFNSYLVLSDTVPGQKLAVQNFTKVFMMGRVKALPNNVVRVMKKQELIQLLKK